MKVIVTFFFICLVRSGVPTFLDKNWWKHTEIYDIEVGAFKDSDGDGFGDFEGLTSKLGYIKELGFDAIKLSPMYSSTDTVTLAYAIDDFKKIHVTHGTIHDFDKLMKEATKKGIKVILDFSINHCSTYHEWFQKSQHKVDPYTDYFIWKKPLKTNNTTIPPPYSYHWKWDDTREELFYYYHDNTADLNLRNNAVKEEVKNLIKFWFDKGVSGLNLLFANLYMEDPSIKEEIRARKDLITNLPESYDFVHELREFVDAYNEKNGGYERILILNLGEKEKYKNLRGNDTFPIAHIVSQNIFQKLFQYKPKGYWDVYYPQQFMLDSNRCLVLVRAIMEELKNGPTLFVSESVENNMRLSSLFKDKQLLNTWIMLLFMCPGTIHFYYGEEIGLDQYRSVVDTFVEAYPCGSSMHWDDSMNAGFTSSEFAVIPPNIDYWNINVKKFKELPRSTYHMVRELLQSRKSEVVKYGDLQTFNVTESVFAFSRSLRNEQIYLAVLNFANIVNSVSLCDMLNELPDYAKVVVTTPNALHSKGEKIDTRSPLLLAPSSGIVLSMKN